MIIDEAVYLEHHGVKGQRWGVRRKNRSPLRKQQIKALKMVGKEAGKGAAKTAGAFVLASAIFAGSQKVSKILAEKGALKLSGVVFQKGGTTVFAPGKFFPGDFTNASVPVKQLTMAAKALMP